MAGLTGGDLSDDGTVEEIYVSDKVEHLVADELVGKTQFRVDDLVFADDDEVVYPAAGAEPQFCQLFKILEETKRPGGSYVRDVVPGVAAEAIILGPDGPCLLEMVIDL